MPTTLPKGLKIGCYLKRGKRNDCIIIDHSRFPNISNLNNTAMNKDFRIGTSSLRRCAMIKHYFPEISLSSICGNLNTRLKKLIKLQLYDAIILAQIGVERLGWHEYSQSSENMNEEKGRDDNVNVNVDVDVDVETENKSEKKSENENKNENETLEYAKKTRISAIDTDIMPYCVGQGGLAIVCRDDDDDMLTILDEMNDIYCNLTCLMERRLLYCLQGGCKIPIGCRSNVLIQCNCCKLWNIMNDNGVYRDKCQACFVDIKLVANSRIGKNSSNNYNSNKNSKSKRPGIRCNTIQLRLYGEVLTQDGKRKVKSDETINVEWDFDDSYQNNLKLLLDNAEKIGNSVSDELKNQGADKIIEKIKQDAILEAAQKASKS